MPVKKTDFSKRWKELSGDKHWENMLKPVDHDLKLYLTHYGDLVEATYSTFVTQTISKFAGGNLVPKDSLFSAAMIMGRSSPFGKYHVTSYLYATSDIQLPPAFMVKSIATNPWTKDSNWIGYTAVATDEGKAQMGRRDIVIAWRGTIMGSEWAKDFDTIPVPSTKLFKNKHNPMLHQGFYSVYVSSNAKTKHNKTSARDQAITELKKLLEQYKNEDLSITVIGHSLGAALATLNAADIVANDITGGKKIPVTAFPFASPRVGNAGFKKMVDELGAATNSSLQAATPSPEAGVLRILRLVNFPDIVPTVPPAIAGFVHVGQKFEVNSSLIKFMKDPYEIPIAHCMEVYIQCINAAKGSLLNSDNSMVEYKRDIALLNKFHDALKPEYNVQPKWWCPENTGMTRQKDGTYQMTAGDWILKEGGGADEEESEN